MAEETVKQKKASPVRGQLFFAAFSSDVI